MNIFPTDTKTTETFTNPVANGADPYVFKDTDGTYYLYVTSGGAYGYRVYTSKNLVEWDARGYCLRRKDVYTDDSFKNKNGEKLYNFWAPEIIKDGDTYYMVYTAQEHIGIAAASSPLGPFTNEADGFLLPTFKNIDGHFFRDDDGRVYLYFVSAGPADYNGCSVKGGNNIWGGEIDLAMQKFKTAPKLLLAYDKTVGQGGSVRDSVAEGPEILKHNGKYYLTYSASAFTDPCYAVHYATSDSPLGPFEKYSGNPILRTDDPDRKDVSNPHLYGTAHHCFTTSPDDKEMIIVYHAHRTGSTAVNSGIEERRICVDLTWFDENGVLHAGRNRDGVPTATAQVLPSGGRLMRRSHYDGVFAPLADLPVRYVAQTDGLDTNEGTFASPLKTLTEAHRQLPNGGTIVLTQALGAGAYFKQPAVNGPILIHGLTGALPFGFQYISLSTDTYFDNIAFMPATVNNISVIECGAHNVTMGDGVSCIAQPTRGEFPCIVGGKWRCTDAAPEEAYGNFRYENDEALQSNNAYTVRLFGGTWSIATAGSVRDTTPLANTAPNAACILENNAALRPSKCAKPTVTVTGEGAKITYNAVENAKVYAIYKNDRFLAFSDSLAYTDTAFTRGTATYAVAGALHGSCIGDLSDEVTVTAE